MNKEICKKNTMVSLKHLNYLQEIINVVNNKKIDGSIVECGKEVVACGC